MATARIPRALHNVAVEVRRLANDYREHNERRLAAALEAGALLAHARDGCGRGEWGTLLRRVGVHERTARDWMALSRAGVKPATVAGFSGIRRTLELLREGVTGDRLNALVDALGDGAAGFLYATLRAQHLWNAAHEATDGAGEVLQAYPDGPLAVRRWLSWEARGFAGPMPWGPMTGS